MICKEEIEDVVVPGGFFNFLLQTKIKNNINELFINRFVSAAVFDLCPIPVDVVEVKITKSPYDAVLRNFVKRRL